MKRTWDQMCEMLEEQAKKIERLNKILILQNAVLDKWLIVENEQKEEIERLRKALNEYGKHKEDCVGVILRAECTCGFRKALKDE